MNTKNLKRENLRLKKELVKTKKHLIGIKEGAKNEKQVDNSLIIKKKLTKKLTKAEKHLSILLKELNINFEFQKIIYLGEKYIILDFVLTNEKIVIEVDGGYHFREDKMSIDINRDNYLKKQGYKVLRISNFKILSLGLDSLRHLLNDFKKNYLIKKLKTYQSYEILTFGKFSGMTINQIYLTDKSYLIWMYRSMIGKFDDNLMNKLKLK